MLLRKMPGKSQMEKKQAESFSKNSKTKPSQPSFCPKMKIFPVPIRPLIQGALSVV